MAVFWWKTLKYAFADVFCYLLVRRCRYGRLRDHTGSLGGGCLHRHHCCAGLMHLLSSSPGMLHHCVECDLHAIPKHTPHRRLYSCSIRNRFLKRIPSSPRSRCPWCSAWPCSCSGRCRWRPNWPAWNSGPGRTSRGATSSGAWCLHSVGVLPLCIIQQCAQLIVFKMLTCFCKLFLLQSPGVAFLYAYGLALSSPFFMSLGELLNLAIAGRKYKIQLHGSSTQYSPVKAALKHDEIWNSSCKHHFPNTTTSTVSERHEFKQENQFYETMPAAARTWRCMLMMLRWLIDLSNRLGSCILMMLHWLIDWFIKLVRKLHIDDVTLIDWFIKSVRKLHIDDVTLIDWFIKSVSESSDFMSDLCAIAEFVFQWWTTLFGVFTWDHCKYRDLPWLA